MQECTFKPKINPSASDGNTSTRNTSMIVVEETDDTEFSDHEYVLNYDHEPKQTEVSLIKLNLSTIQESAGIPSQAKRFLKRGGSVPVKVSGTYSKPGKIMSVINKSKHNREESLKSQREFAIKKEIE